MTTAIGVLALSATASHVLPPSNVALNRRNHIGDDGIVSLPDMVHELAPLAVALDRSAVIVRVSVIGPRRHPRKEKAQDTGAGRAADGLTKAIEGCKGIIVETKADVIVFVVFCSFHGINYSTLHERVQHFFSCSSKKFHVEHKA